MNRMNTLPHTLLATLRWGTLPLLTAACTTVGPTYTPPTETLPDQFSRADAALQSPSATVPEVWWLSLRDPQLTALVQQALADNPDLQAAQARLRQARAVQGIQSALGGPTLGASAKVTQDGLSVNSEAFANIPFKNPQTEFTNHQIGFDASWEIDLWGHQQRLTEAASARSAAGLQRVIDTRLQLAAEVARNYIDLRAAQVREAIATDNLRNFDESLRLSQLLAKVGDGTPLDVQRALVARDNARANLPPLAQAQRQSLAALSVLTTQSVATLETTLAAVATATTTATATSNVALMPVPAAPATGLPADLLRRRPDVRASERDLAAASADIGVATSELYPRFSLIGTGGWASVHSDNLLSHASQLWSIGPQISLPIFNGQRLTNQVKANEAAYDAARANYRKAVLAAVADVEVTLTRLARSEDTRQQLQAALAQQAQLVRLIEKQVKVGEVARPTLLEARKVLASQNDALAQTQAQSLVAFVGLNKALGGEVGVR